MSAAELDELVVLRSFPRYDVKKLVVHEGGKRAHVMSRPRRLLDGKLTFAVDDVAAPGGHVVELDGAASVVSDDASDVGGAISIQAEKEFKTCSCTQ